MNYGYDNLNRLITVTYPTHTSTYSYDLLNNSSRAANENGTIYLGYDSRYRVSSSSDPFFYGVSYNYDAVGPICPIHPIRHIVLCPMVPITFCAKLSRVLGA
jgi:YD repeat-containing protein